MLSKSNTHLFVKQLHLHNDFLVNSVTNKIKLLFQQWNKWVYWKNGNLALPSGDVHNFEGPQDFIIFQPIKGQF